MKALLQAGLSGQVPAPPEKRFLISHPLQDIGQVPGINRMCHLLLFYVFLPIRHKGTKAQRHKV